MKTFDEKYKAATDLAWLKCCFMHSRPFLTIEIHVQTKFDTDVEHKSFHITRFDFIS